MFCLSSGILRGLSEVLSDSHHARAADALLRSLGQVIFLNNPFTGLFLVFSLLLQSSAQAGCIGAAASMQPRRAASRKPSVQQRSPQP
jgi:hypothetical protein